jgi:hypothetical protein
MGDGPTIVVDTNVLLNLATPVVDDHSRAPSGGDPLKAVLSSYDVHVSASVVGEVTEAAGGDDLLAAAATAVLRSTSYLTTHDVATESEATLDYGLDEGESHAIWLANELGAAMLVTDEFGTTNYLLVSLALDDRNVLFTTTHVLCKFGGRGVLDPRYVASVLTYYCETKEWDEQYVGPLRTLYLS